MSELEDGLRSALADAAKRYSPSTGMADRIEAAVTWRERRRRRLATGGAAALALSLSLGVAGASLMSDVGGGGEAKIASPLTTPPLTVPRSTPPGGTTTTPPTGPAVPAPAPSGTACPPPTSGTTNVSSGRDAGSSSASAVVHQALAQLAAPMVSMASTAHNTSASITTGDATSTNTSSSSTTQTNTGGSTTTNDQNSPPPTPPAPAGAASFAGAARGGTRRGGATGHRRSVSLGPERPRRGLLTRRAAEPLCLLAVPGEKGRGGSRDRHRVHPELAVIP